MYAVIETGGKQYRVEQGDVIDVELVERTGKDSSKVTFDRVLLIGGDKPAVGTPVVALDHGGPARLVRLWPHAPAELVRAGSPSSTAKQAARALEKCIESSGSHRVSGLRLPSVTYEEAVLSAYEMALRPL